MRESSHEMVQDFGHQGPFANVVYHWIGSRTLHFELHVECVIRLLPLERSYPG